MDFEFHSLNNQIFSVYRWLLKAEPATNVGIVYNAYNDDQKSSKIQEDF